MFFLRQSSPLHAAKCLRTAARSVSTAASKSSAPARQGRLNPLYFAAGVASAFAAAGAGFAYNQKVHQIRLDTAPVEEDGVQIDKAVDPLPVFENDPLQTTYQLIGYGIRQVSFLRMKVYALGLYIAKEDLPLTKKILTSSFITELYEKPNPDLPQKEALAAALKDSELSETIVDNLLTAGVKFTARVCPLRNTDLSHLRDGFIRTIRNSQGYKELIKDEDCAERVTKGLEELRAVMNSHKMKAYTNSRVFMEIVEGGKLRATVRVFDSNHFRPVVELGTVEEPLISRLLFRCYLSGSNPLCAAARDTADQTLLGLL